MSLFARWRFALKPASWPKLLVPTLLGQSLGFYYVLDRADLDGLSFEPLSWPGVGIGIGFTLCLLVCIVTLNDVGDHEIDAKKRKMFPKSSKKTIPDGVLSRRSLAIVGIAAGAAAIGIMVASTLWLEREHAWVFGLVCIAIFATYTFPPIRLNYRGGGEALEMVGVGVALPLTQAYLQSGQLWPRGSTSILGGYALLSLASAIASGLSDERSDRAGGKRTVASRHGNRAARFAVEGAMAGGAVYWIAVGAWVQSEFAWTLVPASVVVVFFLWSVFVHSKRAKTDAFAAQRRYKGYLHRGIWAAGLVVTVLLPLAAR